MTQTEQSAEDSSEFVNDPIEPTTTFVSHASEDKPIVRDLVDTLIRYGVKVWFDEYEITIGDPIRRKINEGLGKSRYGVVVLSPTFFDKVWTMEELDTLFDLLKTGHLLPVLHNITIEEVRKKYPTLATLRAESLKDVRRAASLIANKVKGEGIPIENGKRVYRNQTVSMADLIFSEGFVLRNTVFYSCKIQGPMIIVPRNRNIYRGNIINDGSMFMDIGRLPMVIVGAVGIEDVEFYGCRFKDVGFFLPQDVTEQLKNARVIGFDEVPEHLQ